MPYIWGWSHFSSRVLTLSWYSWVQLWCKCHAGLRAARVYLGQPCVLSRGRWSSHWVAVLFQWWSDSRGRRRAAPRGADSCPTRVITTCLTCIQTQFVLINGVTADTWEWMQSLIVVPAHSHARALFFPSLASLILSHLSHITSDCKTDKASWHVSLPIQTASPWRTVSLWTLWLLSLGPAVQQEAAIKYRVIHQNLRCCDSCEQHFSLKLRLAPKSSQKKRWLWYLGLMGGGWKPEWTWWIKGGK